MINDRFRGKLTQTRPILAAARNVAERFGPCIGLPRRIRCNSGHPLAILLVSAVLVTTNHRICQNHCEVRGFRTVDRMASCSHLRTHANEKRGSSRKINTEPRKNLLSFSKWKAPVSTKKSVNVSTMDRGYHDKHIVAAL